MKKIKEGSAASERKLILIAEIVTCRSYQSMVRSVSRYASRTALKEFGSKHIRP